MYINKASVTNIRNLQQFDWVLGPGEEPGWHVVLGDNGVGKTTFLEALALALIGDKCTGDLDIEWNHFLRAGQASGAVHVETCYPFLAEEQQPKHVHYDIALQRSADKVSVSSGSFPPEQSPRDYMVATPFASSFGPSRRLQQGTPRMGKVSIINPLYRHLSLFDASIAFSDTIDWLLELPILKAQGLQEGLLLDHFMGFINGTALLPDGVQLARIDEEGVYFIDNGHLVTLEQLSSGPASIICMLFELVHQLAAAFGPENVFRVHEGQTIVPLAGVVLIDTIEAGLPPNRQAAVGPWFCQRFPGMQFIVTTYSQVICKAASRGSVWRIPNPSEKSAPHRLTGDLLARLTSS